MAQKLNLKIVRGKTFSHVLRWGALPFLYKPITAIAKTAPARLTVTGHGIPDRWSVAPVSVQGMTEINAENAPPKQRDYLRATVIDANTIDLNSVNASEFSTYESGGYLQMRTPVSLAGCTARMTIKDRVGGTALVTLTSSSGIALDDTAKTITVTITAAAAAAFTWTRGVYDLEIVSGSVVTLLMYGSVTVASEVTT